MKNVIFFSGSIDLRAGGPAGYIANLKKGLELIKSQKIQFIVGSKTNSSVEFRKKISKLLTFWIPVKKHRRKLRKVISESFF